MAMRAQNINPSILAWARGTAALSIDDAARKIGLNSSKKASAAEKLESFEKGETHPTRNQLFEIARAYHRPLTTFYLANPPRKANRGADFRTLRGKVSARDDALLDALLRDVFARQNLVKAILEDNEDTERLEFISSIPVDSDVQTAADKIKAKMQIKRDDWASERANPKDLFDHLRNKIESLGVFVLLMGDLGSQSSIISEKVFRGFVIADEIAPFVVINERDACVAQPFTLAHELVNLFVGTTGVSALPATRSPRSHNERIEQFCNDVAAEMLLPRYLLKDTPGITDMESAKYIISKIAEDRNLSESMIAYRLQRTGRIGGHIYSDLCTFYEERWQDYRQRAKTRTRKGGPSYYVMQRRRLGKALLDLARRTLGENQLTHTAAARMLGVKPNSVETLLHDMKDIGGPRQSKTGI